MDLPVLFLKREDVLEYHSEQIALYGGLDGLADAGLLDSALASPENLYLYDHEAGIFDIATAYAFHIAKNHAFHDGNKRTGLQAALAFLKDNGYEVETDDETIFEWMEGLTDSSISRETFTERLCACSVREGGLTVWLRRLFPL